METEDVFHWHIYNCCRLHEIHSSSFFCQCWFKNFIFMLARNDVQCYSSFFLSFFFFCSLAWLLKNSFLFSQPGPLENMFLLRLSFVSSTHWKIQLSFSRYGLNTGLWKPLSQISDLFQSDTSVTISK